MTVLEGQVEGGPPVTVHGTTITPMVYQHLQCASRDILGKAPLMVASHKLKGNTCREKGYVG